MHTNYHQPYQVVQSWHLSFFLQTQRLPIAVEPQVTVSTGSHQIKCFATLSELSPGQSLRKLEMLHAVIKLEAMA